MEQDNSLSHEDLLMAAINAGASVELFKEIMMESQDSGSYNYSLVCTFIKMDAEKAVFTKSLCFTWICLEK